MPAGMLKLFKEAGELNSRNTNFQFRKQDNEPKVIYTPDFAKQKLEYIYNNPADAGIVEKPENIFIAVQETIIMGNNVDY